MTVETSLINTNNKGKHRIIPKKHALLTVVVNNGIRHLEFYMY